MIELVDNRNVKYLGFLSYGEAVSNYVSLICLIVPFRFR